jgi:hypothetical protein
LSTSALPQVRPVLAILASIAIEQRDNKTRELNHCGPIYFDFNRLSHAHKCLRIQPEESGLLRFHQVALRYWQCCNPCESRLTGIDPHIKLIDRKGFLANIYIVRSKRLLTLSDKSSGFYAERDEKPEINGLFIIILTGRSFGTGLLWRGFEGL